MGVAIQDARRIRSNLSEEFNLFFVSPFPEGIDDLPNKRAELEVKGFQFKFASFDLREVENIVDNIEERFA